MHQSDLFLANQNRASNITISTLIMQRRSVPREWWLSSKTSYLILFFHTCGARPSLTRTRNTYGEKLTRVMAASTRIFLFGSSSCNIFRYSLWNCASRDISKCLIPNLGFPSRECEMFVFVKICKCNHYLWNPTSFKLSASLTTSATPSMTPDANESTRCARMMHISQRS